MSSLSINRGFYPPSSFLNIKPERIISDVELGEHLPIPRYTFLAYPCQVARTKPNLALAWIDNLYLNSEYEIVIEVNEHLLACVQDDDYIATLLSQTGRAYVAKDNVDLGRRYYEQSMLIALNCETQIAIAELSESEGDFSRAVEEYHYAISLSASDTLCSLGQSDILYLIAVLQTENLHDRQSGLVSLLRATHISDYRRGVQTTESKVYWRMGSVLYELGESSDAVVALEESIRLYPRQYYARIQLAKVEYSLDDTLDAFAEVHKAISIRPSLSIGYLVAADLYNKEGKVNQACFYLEKGISQNMIDDTKQLIKKYEEFHCPNSSE